MVTARRMEGSIGESALMKENAKRKFESISKSDQIIQETIKNKLALFDLLPSIQTAVDGGFPLREAIKLASHPRDEQLTIFEKLVSITMAKGTSASAAIRPIICT